MAGQRVRRGDPIVEFEHAPFDAAAQSAAATLANAERADARAQRLVQAGILPQKDADQAAADLAVAQSAAVTARRAQELATLRAPLAGVVTRMSAVLGESVDAGQTLVEVADPTALDVVFNVSPAEAARIQVRDTVYLRIGEATGADDVRSAEITAALAVDSASRAVATAAWSSCPRARAHQGIGRGAHRDRRACQRHDRPARGVGPRRRRIPFTSSTPRDRAPDPG